LIRQEFHDLFVGEALGKSADFGIPRCTLGGMKRILYPVAALVAAAVCSTAAASGAYVAKAVHLNAQKTNAAFSVRIPKPKKIILYIGQANVTTTTRCLKGAKVSKLTRSFNTDGTRNMLWHIASRQDVCHVSVTAALRGQGTGYVSVEVYPRLK
jgi:hypothetical protein